MLARFCGQCARALPFLCFPWPNSNYPVPNEVLCGQLFGARGRAVRCISKFYSADSGWTVSHCHHSYLPTGLFDSPSIKIHSCSLGHRTNCLMTIWNRIKTGKQTRLWNKIRDICDICLFSEEVELILWGLCFSGIRHCVFLKYRDVIIHRRNVILTEERSPKHCCWGSLQFFLRFGNFNKDLAGVHALSRDIAAVEWRWVIQHHLAQRLRISRTVLSPYTVMACTWLEIELGVLLPITPSSESISIVLSIGCQITTSLETTCKFRNFVL